MYNFFIPPLLIFRSVTPKSSPDTSEISVSPSPPVESPTWRFRFLQLELIAFAAASTFIYFSVNRYLENREDHRRRLSEARRLLIEERKSKIRKFFIVTGAVAGIIFFTKVGRKFIHWSNQAMPKLNGSEKIHSESLQLSSS